MGGVAGATGGHGREGGAPTGDVPGGKLVSSTLGFSVGATPLTTVMKDPETHPTKKFGISGGRGRGQNRKKRASEPEVSAGATPLGGQPGDPKAHPRKKNPAFEHPLTAAESHGKKSPARAKSGRQARTERREKSKIFAIDYPHHKGPPGKF